jgi:uncharacterized membrane protein YgdD (TMEM256/DUF423 family)
VRVAAAAGFLAVALGAFGAHGLKDLLERTGGAEWWRTASFYHLTHAAVLLWVAGRSPFRKGAFVLFLAGIVLFSGSLYGMGVTGFRPLGAVAPLGGVALLAGWLVLALLC